ncbi:hypothetical protein KO317_01570 [Candidatus Micrarchaeota archaeon]|nr:hypothetical protein [Candidatus Micrarchaeota archaeon]
MDKIRRAKLYLTTMLDIKTIPLMILGMLFVMNFAFANGIDNLTNVFLALACDIHKLLIPIGFLLVVAAAVIYAGGQVGNAEMRGKSQGWAVWALVGAIMAFVIAMLGPALIGAMYSTTAINFSNCPSTCSLSAGSALDCSAISP